MTEEEVINAVRFRYRTCNYLFRLGIAWFAIGVTLGILHYLTEEQSTVVEIVGAGVFTAAFAMTLAIYRCPACDHYLNKFRPNKEKCAHCGAKVR